MGCLCGGRTRTLCGPITARFRGFRTFGAGLPNNFIIIFITCRIFLFMYPAYKYLIQINKSKPANHNILTSRSPQRSAVQTPLISPKAPFNFILRYSPMAFLSLARQSSMISWKTVPLCRGRQMKLDSTGLGLFLLFYWGQDWGCLCDLLCIFSSHSSSWSIFSHLLCSSNTPFMLSSILSWFWCMAPSFSAICKYPFSSSLTLSSLSASPSPSWSRYLLIMLLSRPSPRIFTLFVHGFTFRFGTVDMAGVMPELAYFFTPFDFCMGWLFCQTFII